MNPETSHTLDAYLLARAARDPKTPVYTFLDSEGAEVGSLTAFELAAQAAAVAERLGRGSPGDEPERVLVCTRGGALEPVALFGCWLAGATAVPVYAPSPGDDGSAIQTIARVARASGAQRLLAPADLGKAMCDALGKEEGASLKWVPLSIDGSPAPEALPLPSEEPGGRSRGALILYTSGSTGLPKGVILTHGAWLSNLRDAIDAAVPGGFSRGCVWLPHAHVAGMYTRLMAIMDDHHAVVAPPGVFLNRPSRWLEIISCYRCTTSAAPNFAYNLVADSLTDAEVAGLDLSCWKMAISGGEKLQPSTLDALHQRLAPAGLLRGALVPYYGMTETLCTTITRGGQPPLRVVVSKEGLDRGRMRSPAVEADAVELVANGPPVGADTELIIVHPEMGVPSPEGWIGELWTRGPGVTPGYFGEPDLTESRARAYLADGRGPWFRTGDMGALHRGQLLVTGRLKELLIVRGKNHYPTDIEATVQRVARLGEQRCAAITVLVDGLEGLGLVVEAGGESAEDVTGLLRTIRQAVARRHGLAIAQLYFVPEGSIPRTASNKLARQRCREVAESGAWASFAATVSRRTRERESVIAGTLGLEGLSGAALRDGILPHVLGVLADGEAGAKLEDTPIVELGLSSLEVAQVAARLRAMAGVEPPFGALFDGSTPRDLGEALAQGIEGTRNQRTDVAGWRVSARKVAQGMPNVMPQRRALDGEILLTGATGFLGRYLLAALLSQGEIGVRCLVRAPDEAAAMGRLVAALADGPGWDEAWRPRITALCGDVTQPRLGLSEAAWRDQHLGVATIVHNAANVNFVAPYGALAGVNVEPVHALAELAALGGELKTIHLVSTLAVFNATQRREQRVIRGIDRLLKPDFHYSGYAQTKWVAEACFRAAGSRGVPLGIHRPGIITGHAGTGHTNTEDFLCRLIMGCVQLGYYPDTSLDLDLVAVDDVAEGIAAAALRSVRTIDTFHWSSHPQGIRLAEMMEVIASRGHALRPEPLHQWLGRIRSELPITNALFPVHPFLLEIPPGSDETILEHFDGLPLNVQTTEADALRAEAGLTHRRVDEAVIHRLAAWLEAQGALPTPSTDSEEGL